MMEGAIVELTIAASIRSSALFLLLLLLCLNQRPASARKECRCSIHVSQQEAAAAIVAHRAAMTVATAAFISQDALLIRP
jgi:hypothetical protein